MPSLSPFVSNHFKGHFCAFIWIFCLRQFCLAELNDGHYDEEDDAKVLPIVLPIVIVVVIVCIIACCWQGKKCPCNKEDNSKKKKRENEESNIRDFVRTENEKSSTRGKSGANGGRPSRQQQSIPPPDYSSVAGQRTTHLPGRPSTRQEVANGDSQYRKKNGYHSKSGGTTSGYDTEGNSHVRQSDKYRVYDEKSSRSHGSRRDHDKYSESNRSGHGGRGNGNDMPASRDYYAHR